MGNGRHHPGNTEPAPAIRLERLKARLAGVNQFGVVPGRKGLFRRALSPADMAARHWLVGEMEGLGLQTRLDPMGNVVGRWEVGSGPAVMVGSHLDTVPDGGRFDGILGAMAALECVETLMEDGPVPAAPIEVVATCDEEGRFGGMLGSQGMAGMIDRERIEAATDDEGETLVDAMRAAGLDPAAYAAARRDPSEIKAYLELHVEQGPMLDRAKKRVGIVEGISGLFDWTVTFTGETNHNGTTPMELRRDAFRGLADFTVAIPAILEEAGTPTSRLTVGRVEVHPNSIHTVPGHVEFFIAGRDLDEDVMHAMANACRVRLAMAAEAHGLEMALDEVSWLSPAPCHPDIVAAFRRQAERLGLDAPIMPSGAAHDAQVMAHLTRIGMVFVPSVGGVSHAPEEHTEWADIEVGCNLLLNTVLDVAAL